MRSLVGPDRADALAVSPARRVSFTYLEIADIERYLDAMRAETLFARGIIVVEGAAELVPRVGASGLVHRLY